MVVLQGAALFHCAFTCMTTGCHVPARVYIPHTTHKLHDDRHTLNLPVIAVKRQYEAAK